MRVQKLSPAALLALLWPALWLAASAQGEAARPPAVGRLSFVVGEAVLGPRLDGPLTLKVEARNKLNTFEPPRSLTLRLLPASAHRRDQPFHALATDGPVPFEKLLAAPLVAERGTPGGGAEVDFVIAAGEVKWPGAEEATVFYRRSGARAVSFQDLPVPPSKYEIRAELTAGAETLALVSKEEEVSAGRSYSVNVRSPGFRELVVERFWGRESLLLTLVVALFAVLATVLKERIKDAANWLLDSLGRFGSGKLAERRFVRRYLSIVISQHKYLRLVGLNTAGLSRPLLEEVFVSLRIVNQAAGGSRAAGGDGTPAAAVPFAVALRQHPKMVILGGPGAGKTTTLSYALLSFARDEGGAAFGVEERRLPLFIPLRRLTNSARAVVDDLLDGETQILTPEVLKEHPKNFFEKKLRRGECVVLLDGLDEVVDEATQRRVADKINAMVAAYPGNRYVVTCRTAGWGAPLSGEFAVLQTQDFNREEIQRFVYGWHRAVIAQTERALLQSEYDDPKKLAAAWAAHVAERVKPAVEARTRTLLAAIDASSRILAIAVNPMLLSLICLVHHVRRVLPKGRPVLYSQCIELLIDAWDRSRGVESAFEESLTPQQKEAVLREIAFEFQKRGVSEDTRESLEQTVAAINRRLGVATAARELLRQIEQRSGLLIERSLGVFGFSHLTLQEYLIARHVQLNYGLRGLLLSNLDRQAWREVVLLYAGLLDDATDLVRRIVAEPVPARLVLAGHCIGDAQHCGEEVAEEVVRGLLELLELDPQSEEVVESLASVAADYAEMPATAGQKLSVHLMDAVTRAPFPRKLAPISILGRARVTKALPVLTPLLSSEVPEVHLAVADALASFGNLSLPEIELHFVAPATQSRAPFAYFADAPRPRLEETALCFYFERWYGEGGARAAALATLLRCVDALTQINTTAAAKLMMKLYDCPDAEVTTYVSLGLSRMLKNSLIEADLYELSAGQLPDAVRRTQPDEAGWRYALPADSGFPHLDTVIRRDLYFLISVPRLPVSFRPASSLPDRMDAGELLRDSSFKLLFPTILNLIRHRIRVDGVSWVEGDWLSMRGYFAGGFNDYFATFGFDHVEEEKITHLASQVEFTSPAALDYSLRNSAAPSPQSQAWWRRPAVVGDVSEVINGSFYILIWVASAILYPAILFPPEGKSFDIATTLVPTSIFLLFHVFFFAASFLRMRRQRVDLLMTFFMPALAFLEILPHVSRARLWVKVLVFHLLLFVWNMAGVAIPITLVGVMFEHPVRLSEIAGVGIPLTLLTLAASLFYLKFVVLIRNPIYELMLLHPEGRRLAGVAQEAKD